VGGGGIRVLRPRRTAGRISASSLPASRSLFPAGTSSTSISVGVQRGARAAGRSAGSEGAHSVALHLTRLPVTIPGQGPRWACRRTSKQRAGLTSRANYRPDQPRGGTVIVQGTSAMAQRRQAAAGAGMPRGLQREDRLRGKPQLFAPPTCGLPGSSHHPGGSRRFHDHHDSGALADARLAVQQTGRRLTPSPRIGDDRWAHGWRRWMK